jgi:hypothetical protein
MRIIKAVGTRVLSGQQLSIFRNIMHRAGRRTAFRHKLAHWAIGYVPSTRMNTLEDLEGFKVALMPPIASLQHARIMSRDDQPIFPEQIEEFSTQCTALFTEIVALSDQLIESRKETRA